MSTDTGIAVLQAKIEHLTVVNEYLSSDRNRAYEVLDEIRETFKEALRRAKKAEAVLASVRELHSPDMTGWKDGIQPGPGVGTCRGCELKEIGRRYWVDCPTVRLLDQADRNGSTPGRES